MSYNTSTSTSDGIPADEIAKVLKRSRGMCEMCGSSYNLQISHRTAKAMGGAHGERAAFINSAENLDHLCELCHAMLMHRQVVRYVIGTNVHSCWTCRIREDCLPVAIDRGFITPEWTGPHPALE